MASNQGFSPNPDTYTVLGKLGEGWCGEVCMVKDEASNVYAVRKVNLAKLARGGNAEAKQNLRETALKEVKEMKSLSSHQNLVHVYDYFEAEDTLHISMELCCEGLLNDAINRKRRSGEWFEESLVTSWLVDLASALNYCHINWILHRDIKPQNIFLVDGGHSLKLGDFGIAKVWHTTSKVPSNVQIATLPYMPPEVFREDRYSYKSEVWVLGCVMYAIMAQKLPFMAKSHPELMLAIVDRKPVDPIPPNRYSAELRHLVTTKMLCKNEAERPSMGEVLSTPFIRQEIAKMAINQVERPVAANESGNGLDSKVDVASLLWASETGDLTAVSHALVTMSWEQLVDKTVWLKSAVNCSAETPLHRAARANQVGVLKLLWPLMGDELGLAEDADHVTPIARATLSNAINAVEYFLEMKDSYLNVRDSQKERTILHLAAEKGYVDLCRKLVGKFGADLFAMSKSDDRQDMPIHLAALYGHLPVVQYFLSVRPELEEQTNSLGEMPIHNAALEGRTNVVEYFLEERHQSIEVRSRKGRTVLHDAASKGHVELCQKLVSQHGADVLAKSNADDNEVLPIHLASSCGHLRVVKFFVSLKPELQSHKDGYGNLAIHSAANEGRIDVVEFFLKDRRQSVESRGFKGRTILHHAAEKGHVELCDKLVNEYDADMFAKSGSVERGAMPIHLAAFFGNLSVVVLFVNKNRDLIKAKTGRNETPLHCARTGVKFGEATADRVVSYLKDQ